MRVNFVYNRIPHHASRSGYEQIVRYLAGQVALATFEGDIPWGVPWRGWECIVARMGPWIARRAGLEWYDPYSLVVEMRAALRLMRERNELFHFLYGENTYRYFGAINSMVRPRGGRIVCTYHQPPGVFARVVRCKQIVNKLDAVVVVASNQAEYFASFVGHERVSVIPLGVDTGFYRPKEVRESNGTECLFVGQWLRDFEMLHAVVNALATRQPSLRFTIVTHQDSVCRFGSCANVVAVTRISDDELLQAYQSADLLVLPLQDCTANCALLEGMACGLPVVTTDVGGIRDYVDPGCAVVVRPKDVDGMCDAIIALSRDERLRAQMSCNSRTRALGFDWKHVGTSFMRLYQDLAA